MQAAPRSPLPIKPRRPALPFDAASIPRYWAGDSILATHLSNGVNLLFPVGERFFVRSVRHYLERFADDPEMTAQIRGFFGQEGRHAREHERFFEVLRAQGYEIDDFLKYFEKTLRTLESYFPPELALAATAAGEHFTAIMAENAFADEAFYETMHPVMRDLFLWHAAEEIEHKSVAFDVFEAVDGRYAVRVAGMALAATFLALWWTLAVRMLLAQDGVDRKALRRDVARIRRARREAGVSERRIGRDVFLRGIREYLARDFHPWNRKISETAKRYIAALDA